MGIESSPFISVLETSSWEAELEFGGLSIPLSVGTSHLSLPMLHVAIRI